MKKIVQLSILILLTVCFITTSVNAQFAAGTGTHDDPYQVTTPAELNNVRNYLGDVYAGVYFKMMNDIDLKAYLATGDGFTAWGTAGWDAIGNSTNPFQANFDGDYHKIAGLLITRGIDSIGLFGYLGVNAVVKKLEIELDATNGIHGSAIIGGLAANSFGTVSNCYVTGSITGSQGVGGLIGFNAGTISCCYTSGATYATFLGIVGGLVGQNSGLIVNCYSRGMVTGSTTVGGLVGYNHGGTITNSFSTGALSGANLGGITATTDNGGSVNNSYWDTITSGNVIISSGSDPSFGKSTSEMKVELTFSGWDFKEEITNGYNDFWGINGVNNDGYPYLTWQYFAPSIQDSEIVFSNIQNTQITISWTNGNGAWRAAFVKEGSGPITNPDDYSTYTSSANWASKGSQLGISGYYCVFNGNGNTVTLTGLTAETTYTVQVFEFNGPAEEEKYNISTTPGNPNSESTTPDCLNPTDGGTIASAQGNCNPFDPAELTSSTSPSGYTGTLEYQWQISTDNINFSNIFGANSSTYDTNEISTTTWYRRLSRVDCKTDWTDAIASNTLEMTIYTPEDPTITGDIWVCLNQAGVEYYTESGMTGYNWSITGGTITTGAGSDQVTVTWDTVGDQTLSLKYADTNGCTGTTYDLTVHVLPLPVPEIDGDTIVSNGMTEYYGAFDIESHDYVWTVSSGGTIVAGQGSSTIYITWDTLGPQTVTLTYTNADGCSPLAPTVMHVLVKDSIWYVNQNATGANTGVSWIDAFTDFQDALTYAGPDERIWVATGTYHPRIEIDGTGPRFSTFQMPGRVAIYGGFAGYETNLNQRDIAANETILSGDLDDNDSYSVWPWTGTSENCYHIFYHPSNVEIGSESVLDGFIIQGGFADSSLYPMDRGAGMYNEYCSPSLINCTFRNNYAMSYGGAMHNYSNSHPVLLNCLFFNNRANGGGAIINQNADPQFINCTFSGNTAVVNGGGIYNESCAPTISNSIIYNNTAGSLGNQVFINGQGLTTLNLNCYNSGSNEIYAQNGGAYNPISCITTDPGFVNQTIGDFRLYGFSACIDMGDSLLNNQPTDIRGGIFGRRLLKTDANLPGQIDMGAYEYKFGIDLADSCLNPSDGGSISDNQFGCYPFDPAIITNLSLPANYSGTLEYKWQMSVSPYTSWTDINSNTSTYDPDTITETTYFKRLAKVTCESSWLESNVTKAVVVPQGQVNLPDNQVLCDSSYSTEVDFTSINTATTLLYSGQEISNVNPNNDSINNKPGTSSLSTIYYWTNDNPSIGLAASGTGNIGSFLAINSGNSSIIANITVTPVIRYFWATVSVSDSIFCPGPSRTFTITVDPTSIGGSVAGSTNVCTGTNNTTLTLSGQTGTIIKWQFSTDNWITSTDIANTTNSLIVNNLDTTTKYRAIVQSGICNETLSADGTITFEPGPEVTFNYTFEELQLCNGPIELTGGLPSGGTYSGLGISNGFFDPAVTGPGTFNITYTYTDGNGCLGSAANVITVLQPQDVSFTVGDGGDFPNLTGESGIFAYLNSTIRCGGVKIYILSDLTEDGSNSLDQSNESSPGGYSITIYAADSSLKLISGSCKQAMIRLNGIDRFTIDGDSYWPNKNLKFRNLNSRRPTFLITNGVTSSMIHGCIIEGNNNDINSGVIILESSSADNSNFTFSHNTIGNLLETTAVPANLFLAKGNGSTTNSAIYLCANEFRNFSANGIYVTTSGNGNYWTINDNSFYSTLPSTTSQVAINFIPGSSSTGNSIFTNYIGGSTYQTFGSNWVNSGSGYFKGISINSSNSIISHNTISNIKSSSPGATAFTGIEILGGTASVDQGNIIGNANIAYSINISGIGTFDGIKSSSSSAVTIKGNSIKNITFLTLTGSPKATCYYLKRGTLDQNLVYNIGSQSIYAIPEIYGIVNASTSVLGNSITNNMIAIKGGNSSNPKLFGIYDQSSLNAGKILCNSVYISGTASINATNSTYAFYRNGSALITIYNNILCNAKSTTTNAKHFAVYSTSTSLWSSDYNDLYAISQNLGYWNGAIRTNLTAWKSATGKDANSISVLPVFMSQIDLHLTNANAAIDNKGTPTNGMTYDFDGAPRSLQTPDIGADEFGNLQAYSTLDTIEEPGAEASLSIYPNPMQSIATMSITLGLESQVSLIIYNVIGEIVYATPDHVIQKGLTKIEFKTSNMIPGIYICRMVVNKQIVIVKRIEVIR